ncbi:MAG: SDR family NAD(P)-dependent oxidoreductase [Acidobacteria bacterium]|nr:SDR family NAD(P)-dependent oxidoreductase [Acidobacteriota bacterium]
MNIQRSTALVTGANRGIGRAIVGALLHEGAERVYATARRLDDLESVVALDPRRVRALQLDVTNAAEIAAAARSATGVNLLVNNAAVLDAGGPLDAPTDIFRRNMETNFHGILEVTRAFAPVIEATGGGAVVNILSVVALASMPGLAAYNASKAAAWSLTQSLRADLAKRHVEVFAVFPGPVDTDMARGFDMAKAAPSDVAAAVVAGVSAGSEDIFPDPMSEQVYSTWRSDHKAVERQFAGM